MLKMMESNLHHPDRDLNKISQQFLIRLRLNHTPIELLVLMPSQEPPLGRP